MSSQEEQIQQRQANLAELAKLGIEIYPRTFERRRTIAVQHTALVVGDRDLRQPLLRQKRADFRQCVEDQRVGWPALLRQLRAPHDMPTRTESPPSFFAESAEKRCAPP